MTRISTDAERERSNTNRLNEWGDPKQRSVTVTYGQLGGEEIRTHVGIGDNYDDAVADADAQITVPGVWVRLCISQPSAILADIRNDGRERLFRKNRHHEQETFDVPFVAGEPPTGARA